LHISNNSKFIPKKGFPGTDKKLQGKSGKAARLFPKRLAGKTPSVCSHGEKSTAPAGASCLQLNCNKAKEKSFSFPATYFFQRKTTQI
jgi:hypothetical protein